MGAEASCNKPDPAKTVTREVKIRHVCLNNTSTGDLLLRLLSVEELEKEIAMDKCSNCLPLFQSETKPSKAQPKPIDIHSLRYEDGCTCLHLASKSGCIDVCRLLIEACLVDINIRNTPGLTPIHLACLHDHYDVVLYFISQRADMNVRDESGRTPLDYCQSPQMQELVARNTRVNGENDVNEVLPDLNYGHFKWNKEANFSSQNPLRNKGNDGNKKSMMTAPPMQSRNTHSSNNSLSTTRPNSDSTINLLTDEKSLYHNHIKNHKNSSGVLSPRSVTDQGHDSSDEHKEEGTSQKDFFSSPLETNACNGGIDEIPSSAADDDDDVVDGLHSASIILDLTKANQNKPTTTTQKTQALPTPTKVLQIGKGTVGNNPFYQSFRKEGLVEKLDDTRRSGRVVNAKGGSLQRDI